MVYIELSDGRVGYLEDLENEQFKKDLIRNGLTYTLTTERHYTQHMIYTKLSPEQIYYQVGGKKSFEQY